MTDKAPTKTLADISEDMKDIDFCMLSSRAQDGSIGARPMSNNSEVEYEGTSYFFTYDDTRMVEDIGRDPSVGLSYAGKAGLKGIVGAPGMFIHVEGEANIVKDKARFEEHWVKGLDRWFPQGTDTPGLAMLEVVAKRVHYWDGEEEGEVKLPGTAAA
ncbi:pyridoxamine 5'-phosphate oxidase family protein [Aurantiacibacter luteus]|uniref:Pyridoxamine 5'-phosphate oxidase n=1 Tax=Aurantiacibacter luteus TaxID=1581420 RepID=A0A0G9MZP8_9SPHN|nr:pyridoxamine 5'-phosphate oxidase family protein [Aurantiacibacter luteus]KLE34753.1 pyridoxamine 5'-phosphate oxidase [Aurantiacibacter luteus]